MRIVSQHIVPAYFCMIKIHIGENLTTDHFLLKASPFLAADKFPTWPKELFIKHIVPPVLPEEIMRKC